MHLHIISANILWTNSVHSCIQKLNCAGQQKPQYRQQTSTPKTNVVAPPEAYPSNGIVRATMGSNCTLTIKLGPHH